MTRCIEWALKSDDLTEKRNFLKKSNRIWEGIDDPSFNAKVDKMLKDECDSKIKTIINDNWLEPSKGKRASSNITPSYLKLVNWNLAMRGVENDVQVNTVYSEGADTGRYTNAEVPMQSIMRRRCYALYYLMEREDEIGYCRQLHYKDINLDHCFMKWKVILLLIDIMHCLGRIELRLKWLLESELLNFPKRGKSMIMISFYYFMNLTIAFNI